MNKVKVKMQYKTLSEMTVVEIFALGTAREMVRFIRETYKSDEFYINIRLDFSPRRKRSWGGVRNGVGFISLAMHRYAEAQKNKKSISFEEYSSFSNDKVIGSVICANWKHSLAALIAHEIAHAVQFSGVKTAVNASCNLGENSTAYKEKHGIVWKKVYSLLREQYVNGKFY